MVAMKFVSSFTLICLAILSTNAFPIFLSDLRLSQFVRNRQIRREATARAIKTSEHFIKLAERYISQRKPFYQKIYKPYLTSSKSTNKTQIKDLVAKLVKPSEAVKKTMATFTQSTTPFSEPKPTTLISVASADTVAFDIWETSTENVNGNIKSPSTDETENHGANKTIEKNDFSTILSLAESTSFSSRSEDGDLEPSEVVNTSTENYGLNLLETLITKIEGNAYSTTLRSVEDNISTESFKQATEPVTTLGSFTASAVDVISSTSNSVVTTAGYYTTLSAKSSHLNNEEDQSTFVSITDEYNSLTTSEVYDKVAELDERSTTESTIMDTTIDTTYNSILDVGTSIEFGISTEPFSITEKSIEKDEYNSLTTSEVYDKVTEVDERSTTESTNMDTTMDTTYNSILDVGTSIEFGISTETFSITEESSNVDAYTAQNNQTERKTNKDTVAKLLAEDLRQKQVTYETDVMPSLEDFY